MYSGITMPVAKREEVKYRNIYMSGRRGSESGRLSSCIVANFAAWGDVKISTEELTIVDSEITSIRTVATYDQLGQVIWSANDVVNP